MVICSLSPYDILRQFVLIVHHLSLYAAARSANHLNDEYYARTTRYPMSGLFR